MNCCLKVVELHSEWVKYINLYKEMNVWSFKYHIKPQLDLEDTMPNLFSSFELPQMHIRESPHLPRDAL